MDLIIIDNVLQDLLQKKVRISIQGKQFREGRLILFKSICYSYELILSSDDRKLKKIEIPIPFAVEIYKSEDLVYFDYRIKNIAYNSNMLKDILNISKDSKSKFYNTIVEFEGVT